MNIKRSIALLFIFSLVIFSRCKIPFAPEFVKDISNIIAIEGNISIGYWTKIYISTAIPLSSERKELIYLTDAYVSIEDNAGNRYGSVLRYDDSKNPYFEIDSRYISASNKYRLVVYYNNNEYATDFLPVMQSPQIKDITFSVEPDRKAVYFYVSAEGAEDQSRYYKWHYEEDWEFTATYKANAEYDIESEEIIDLNDYNHKYYCWNKGVSSDIIIATSKDLSRNVIHEHKINTILKNDMRISRLYRIRLYQMAISEAEYRYLYNVRKNSEEVGGIFGPQPSEMSGNIKCINDSNIEVLGYISCSTVSIMTKYFTSNEIGIYENIMVCSSIKNFENYSDASMVFAGYQIYIAYPDEPIRWTENRCVDCRVYGTKNKPAFWPTLSE